MLKPMTEQDIPFVVDLCGLMYQESPLYHCLTFSPSRVKEILLNAIVDGFAMVGVDGRGLVIAFMAACILQPAYSRDQMACDYALYVSPLHRGGIIGARLVQAYVAWARSKGARLITAGVTAGIDNNFAIEFYESMGFQQCGVQLRMEV